MKKGLTKRGVCYNLHETPFQVTIDNLTYMFSSAYRMQKFKESYLNRRKEIVSFMTKKFGIDIDVSCLCDLICYSEIENRGFTVRNESGVYLCEKEIRLLIGEKRTMQN
jgi:hypothetical protein